MCQPETAILFDMGDRLRHELRPWVNCKRPREGNAETRGKKGGWEVKTPSEQEGYKVGSSKKRGPFFLKDLPLVGRKGVGNTKGTKKAKGARNPPSKELTGGSKNREVQGQVSGKGRDGQLRNCQKVWALVEGVRHWGGGGERL